MRPNGRGPNTRVAGKIYGMVGLLVSIVSDCFIFIFPYIYIYNHVCIICFQIRIVLIISDNSVGNISLEIKHSKIMFPQWIPHCSQSLEI